MDRIVARVEGISPQVLSILLEKYDVNGNVTGRQHTVDKAEHELWDEMDANFITLKTMYDGGTPLVFGGDLDRIYAETSAAANPSHATFPTHVPEKWMLEQHPFNPRNPFDVIHVSSFSNLPETGQEHTTYVVDDDGNENPTTVIWDGTNWVVTSSTGTTPQSTFYPWASHTYQVIKDGSGTGGVSTAGSINTTGQRFRIAEVTNPAIPATTVSQDGAYSTDPETYSHLNIEEDTSAKLYFSLSGSPVLGDHSAVWYDSDTDSVATGVATRYGIRATLWLRRSGTIYNQWSFSASFLVDPVNPGTSKFDLGPAELNIDLQAGDELLVEAYGTIPSSEAVPVATQINITGGGLRLRRYVSHVAASVSNLLDTQQRIVALDSVTAERPAGALLSTFALDFENDVNIDEFPVAYFRTRFDHFDWFAEQDLAPYDFRNVPIVGSFEDARDFYIGTSNPGSENYHVYVMYHNDMRGRPIVFRGAPWEGWFNDVLYGWRMVFWGDIDARIVRGMAAQGYADTSTDVDYLLSLEFRKR